MSASLSSGGGPQARKIRVGYILSYYSPHYIRSTTLTDALRKMENVKLFEARNKSKGLLRYIETILKLVKMRAADNPDIYILGFRGHEIFPIVRLLTLRKRMIFDSMMSPYYSIKEEKKYGIIGSIISPFIYVAEALILRCSQLVITDTNSNRKLLLDTFKLTSESVKYIYVGCNEISRSFNKENYFRSKTGKFEVFFYSTFLPLHGVPHIVEAAHILRKKPIQFTIIGGKSASLKKFYKSVEALELRNIAHKSWVEFEELPRYISRSDLCLGGPFGNTGQAKRIITGKTYQFISMGKPTVVGRIDEDVGFRDKVNCLLVEQGDSKFLAEAIIWAYENRDKLKSIGFNARKLFLEKFSTDKLSEMLYDII